MRKENLRKTHKSSMRVRFTVVHGRDQADQSTVSAVARNGVRDHPELAIVFTGNDSAATVVPVKNQSLIYVLLNYILVHNNFGSSWNRERDVSGMNRIPTGSR